MSARTRLATQGESCDPSAVTVTVPAAADVDLPTERVEAAFGTRKNTHVGSNVLSDRELTVAAAVTTSPRGLRLDIPPLGNGLIGFVTEQRWQGYVIAVEDHTFRAIVHDESPDFADEIEEVEFDREDVAELMRSLIQPGAVFFWDIGYQVEPSGQRTRQSIVSFPMIPMHTRQRIDQALLRGRGRFIDLGWDKSSAQRVSGQPEDSSQGG